jgi:hypothetical protein
MITDGIAILIAVQEQQYFGIAIALVSMCSNIGAAGLVSYLARCRA